jgi:uncharacterized protein
LVDTRKLFTSILLMALLLVVGEILRALAARELWTPLRTKRQPLFEANVLIAAIVLFVVTPILASIAFGHPPPATVPGLEAQMLASTIELALLMPLLVASGKNRLADYGIERNGWKSELRYGGLGFLVSIPFVFAILLLTAPLRRHETEHPFLQLLQGTSNGLTILQIIIATVILAPLIEELVFRVILQGFLETKFSPAVAVFVPAFAFAAIHPWPDSLPLFPLAVVLGIVFHARRSYVAVVTMHAMFNAANLVLGLWN